MKTRTETLRNLASETFDLCVIGGGATGAGCALDARLRGLKTVLIEAADFASATSSASTKMVHGGVRYLQEAVQDFDPGQYRVVKRALHERRSMLSNAPFLAHPLAFLIPCYSRWEAFYYSTGVKTYEWIAGEQNLFPSRYYTSTQALERAPLLSPRRLRGTVAYADGQFDDARYAMALVNSFIAAGGDALNYARVAELHKDATGRLTSAVVHDQIARSPVTVRARVFVNATGPFSDHVRQMANPGLRSRLRLSKGAHILLPLPAAAATDGILVPKTDDGRVIFAIPWLGRLLVGTTDTEVSAGEEICPTRSDAEFLLQQLNRYLSSPYTLAQVVSAFAGVRPLVSSGAGDTKRLIRDHEVEIDSASGLVSVLGGKWTTYRGMAEDGVDAVQRQLGMPVTPSPTRDHPLAGAAGYTSEYWRTLAEQYGVTAATARHLAEKFGTRAAQVCSLAQQQPALSAPLVDGFPAIQAEVAYGVQHEMARTLEDVLARRIGLQFFGWKLAIDAAPRAAAIMAPLLTWSEAEQHSAVEQYVSAIATAAQRIGLEPGCLMA